MKAIGIVASMTRGRKKIGPPTPIALPAELKARAEEIASARGISLAELVREALQAHIGAEEGADYRLALVVGQAALAALRDAETKAEMTTGEEL